MSWRVTVAAVIEREGRFLLVEEHDKKDGGRVFNQPAGHVEPGEAILDAVVREAWEETGLRFQPEALLGIYPLVSAEGRDFLRFAFVGKVEPGKDPIPQDADILGCRWVSPRELETLPLRSGLVAQCIQDALAGRRLPMEAIAPLLKER